MMALSINTSRPSALREKCPNTEFCLVWKKLRIWALFTQCCMLRYCKQLKSFTLSYSSDQHQLNEIQIPDCTSFC